MRRRHSWRSMSTWRVTFGEPRCRSASRVLWQTHGLKLDLIASVCGAFNMLIIQIPLLLLRIITGGPTSYVRRYRRKRIYTGGYGDGVRHGYHTSDILDLNINSAQTIWCFSTLHSQYAIILLMTCVTGRTLLMFWFGLGYLTALVRTDDKM